MNLIILLITLSQSTLYGSIALNKAKGTYVCASKSISEKDLKKEKDKCEKTIITSPTGKTIELKNSIKGQRKDYEFNELRELHEQFAVLDEHSAEGGEGKIIDFNGTNKFYKVSYSPKILFSPNKKSFFINGYFNESGFTFFLTDLFSIQKEGLKHEISIRYKDEPQIENLECTAKKCVYAFQTDGYFEPFTWKNENKLTGKRCIYNKVTEVPEKCEDLAIERINNEWLVSWEKKK